MAIISDFSESPLYYIVIYFINNGLSRKNFSNLPKSFKIKCAQILITTASDAFKQAMRNTAGGPCSHYQNHNFITCRQKSLFERLKA